MADNDLLAGNILQMQTAGAPPTGAAGGAGGAGGVRFIDFEYAGPNYRGAERENPSP
jgi:thiamine kinase-like enzyme